MTRRFCALFGLAFAAACADAQPPERPRGTDVLLHREADVIQARVPARATLDGLLRQHELPSELVVAAVESARAVFNPKSLRADQPYRLVRSIDGLLREFVYEIDADRLLRIVNLDREQPSALAAEILPIEKETVVSAVHGGISPETSSLIASMDAAGEHVQLAMALAEIFGGEVDFNNDLQPNDEFEALFERMTRDDEFAGYGEVLAARFRVDGREYHAFRWVHPKTGKAGYYDENGRSLKRQLLSSPLRFEPRVTSRFSRSRMHPVYGVRRAHLGVDYAAPRGSAVVAVADGVVVSAAWSGGGGRMVRLRHARSLETYYLHLSSFAKGIRAGARVKQNQVIGFVGATGTATGPHLDYRMRRNGAFVNPLTAHRQQPPGEPIAASYRDAFRQQRDQALTRLETTLLAEAARRKPDAVAVGSRQ